MKKEFEMKLRTIFALIAFSIILLFTSCASSSGPSGPSEMGMNEARPDWVINPPLDSEYYIGIGTGNNTDDAVARDNAIYRAKSYLAGDILTQISAETKIHDFESSEGEYYESYESNILASMEANLQGTEIVDEWEDKDGTYWVYLRLNIALWEKIQAEEMAELEKRVRNLVEPLVNAPNKSVTEKLTVLWKGWELVYDSPYAGLVDTTMFGEDGDLFDTIERKIISFVNSLSLDVPISNITIEYGRPISIEAEVTTYMADKVGKIPIGFYLNENDTEPAITFNTNSKGIFEGDFALPGLELGKTAVFARINLNEFGIDQSRMVTQMIVPESSFLVDYQQIKVGLVIINSLSDLAGVESGVKALFSEKELPFKISNKEVTEYSLEFELIVEDIPILEATGDIRFSFIRGSFSILKNGRTLYTFETDKYKGSGLDYGQAHERGMKMMFEKLLRVDGIAEGIIDVLDFD